jgi:hypothetical protein
MLQADLPPREFYRYLSDSQFQINSEWEQARSPNTSNGGGGDDEDEYEMI